VITDIHERLRMAASCGSPAFEVTGARLARIVLAATAVTVLSAGCTTSDHVSGGGFRSCRQIYKTLAFTCDVKSAPSRRAERSTADDGPVLISNLGY